MPKAVNIAKSGSAKPIYEFENKAYEGRREVREYAGVTRYSLWDCSYKREVGNEANPVGVARTFYGSLQFNRFNAEIWRFMPCSSLSLPIWPISF